MVSTKALGRFFLAFLLFLALLAAKSMALLNENHGVFTYILDDPYIHLRLAEQILAGNYGVNAGEYSSPSSSVVWSILLIPFVAWGFADWSALILNILSGGMVLFLSELILQRIFITKAHPDRGELLLLSTLLIMPLCSGILPFTFSGMEHTLQMAFALVVILSWIVLCTEKRFYWWGVAAVVVGPTIRYENAAYSFATVVLLYRMRSEGYRFPSVFRSSPILCVILSIMAVLPLGIFGLFLLSLGLDVLPLSVTAKSMYAMSGLNLLTITTQLRNVFSSWLGAWLVLFTFFFTAFKLWSSRASLLEKEFALASAIPGILLMTLGRVDTSPLPRYEGAFWFTALIGVLFLSRHLIARLLSEHREIVFVPFLVLTLFILGKPHISLYTKIATASNNIYRQQYQMGRFVKEIFRAPVAVNDLGLVSIRNPNYVLDLWGLGSKEALDLRMSGEIDQKWMGELVAKKDVGLVMLYEPWFGPLPRNWQKVAELHLKSISLLLGGKTVSFYLTKPELAEKVIADLAAFQKILPKEVKLVTASYGL